MKLIKPYYEILTPIDGQEVLKTIEKVERTCYKSEDKITDDSAEKMVKALISRGHEAIFELTVFGPLIKDLLNNLHYIKI